MRVQTEPPDPSDWLAVLLLIAALLGALGLAATQGLVAIAALIAVWASVAASAWKLLELTAYS